MIEPFIKNHQYNLIKKQIGILQQSSKTVADPKVMEAVRYNAQTRVLEAFPHVSDIQKQILERISELNTVEEYQQYLSSLRTFLLEFPHVTEKQIKKLFPKNKKLKIPELSSIDYHSITYLNWHDIATNKWFMVYPLNGEIVGIEGRFTPGNKKDVCSLCNGVGEVALVTAISKSRPANSSPDYYKAVGNYMCLHSDECNKKIVDVTPLEQFIQSVI